MFTIMNYRIEEFVNTKQVKNAFVDALKKLAEYYLEANENEMNLFTGYENGADYATPDELNQAIDELEKAQKELKEFINANKNLIYDYNLEYYFIESYK